MHINTGDESEISSREYRHWRDSPEAWPHTELLSQKYRGYGDK